MTTTLRTVLAWQEAANAQDVERTLALSAPEITLVGPRGTAQGHAVLRQWLERAGLTLATRQLFARGDSVVAEQQGVWRSPETGEVVSEALVATSFRVADGRVTHLARYEQLDEALAAAGLTRADLYTGSTPDDEQAIRTLVASWHEATAAGDSAALIELMAEEVVFLTPGQPPLRGRASFLAGFAAALQQQRIAPRGTVEEVLVDGDLATCWSTLSVVVTPHDGSAPRRLAGSALSVLRRGEDAQWRIVRDANMLTPVAGDA
jgi:uncharacterized protein (TIGR02246 family)